MERDVTNEQRRRRTLFKPTLWAVASWLIFGVAHSLRIDLDMLVVTASLARTALKISQLTVLEAQCDQWDRVWCVRFVPPASSTAGLFAGHSHHR